MATLIQEESNHKNLEHHSNKLTWDIMLFLEAYFNEHKLGNIKTVEADLSADIYNGISNAISVLRGCNDSVR